MLTFIYLCSLRKVEHMNDAMARLCQTAVFQHVVFQFLDGFIPAVSDARNDLRFILMHWNCEDESIFWSTAKPSEDTAAPNPGIPVGLLPFVLHEIIPPEQEDALFPLHDASSKFLCEFWAVVAVLQSYGPDATPPDVPTSVCAPFVQAAQDFAIAYVRCTHPDSQAIMAVLDRVVPIADELIRLGDPRHIPLVMKIKTLYFGLTGSSTSEEMVRAQIHTEALPRNMAALTFRREAEPTSY